jgi:serine protease Do
MSKKANAVLIVLALFVGGALGLGGGLSIASHAGALAPTAETPRLERTVTTLPVTAETGTALTATEIAAKNADSIVEISTEAMQMGGWIGQFISEGAGSGIIVSADGYIATNNHVIADAGKITVRLNNGTEHEAHIISTDTKTDIAVLKIEAKNLKPVVFGDSSLLRVGDPALVIGNPLGDLGGTVTSGIISALNREITLENQPMNLLQTDAAVNPGNSGGGLFNVYGELVGIVVAKFSDSDVEGLGFAIPSRDAQSVIESLMNYGYVKGRVYVGVNLTEVSDDDYRYRLNSLTPGLYVATVVPGSPADQSGFQPYDRITRAGDAEISSYADLQKILQQHSVGDTISFRVSRDGGETTLRVVLGEYSPDPSNDA